MTADQGAMWHHNFEVPLTSFKDDNDLFQSFSKLLKSSGFNVVSTLRKKFEPVGYSALWLLSESHLAVHTFPEKNKASFQLASCNFDKYKEFISAVADRYGV